MSRSQRKHSKDSHVPRLIDITKHAHRYCRYVLFDAHQHCKTCQVITVADSVSCVRRINLASCVRPADVPMNIKRSFYMYSHGVVLSESKDNREDIRLQILLLLFKFANHRNKRPFVSTANEALVGPLMTIDDVSDIFPVGLMHNYEICSRFTTKLGLHKIIHIIWTWNTVRTWVFFTSLLLWDLASSC